MGVQVETRINCPLSAMQTFWYRRLLLKDTKMLKSLEAEFSNDPTVQVCTPCCFEKVLYFTCLVMAEKGWVSVNGQADRL